MSAAPAAGARRVAGAVPPRLRAWLPWVVAAAILAGLVLRLPRAQIARALAAGPFWPVAAFSAATAAVALVADAWATRAAFLATGVRCRFSDVLVARGATYLLGLLNSVAGQGGMGLYLHRAGVRGLRAAGTVLFLIGTQLAALGAVAAAGVAVEAAAGTTPALARALPVAAAVPAAVGLYLVAAAWPPAWLRRREILAPALGAGAGGFLRAAAARLPQTLVMVAGLWLGLRLWGIPLPFGRGLAVISIVVLVMVLPVAPGGIGTMELAVVELATPAAPGAATALAKSNVLACTLVYHLGGVVAQGLLGVVCLALLPRRQAAACEVTPLPVAGAGG